MDRCPNCGSSVRTGAKFCTTCGFRLPVQPPATPEQPHARSPFDTTSTSYVSSRWPAVGTPAPDPPAESEIVETPESDTAAPVDDAAPGDSTADVDTATESITEPSEPAPFVGWPAFGASDPTADHWAAASDAADATADVKPADEKIASVEDAIFAWSGVPAGEATDDEPATSADTTIDAVSESSEPPSLEASEEGDSELIEPDVAIDEALAVVDAELPLVETEDDVVPDDEDELDVPELADLAVLEGASEEVEAGEDAASYLVEDSPIERVKRLVGELSSLLPLISPASGDPITATTGVLDALAASRAAGDTEADAFQSLRAAVATAQARPRDVDVMLDLVSRADSMAAVLKAHDRYKAAIDAAIAELRGDVPAEPAPRW